MAMQQNQGSKHGGSQNTGQSPQKSYKKFGGFYSDDTKTIIKKDLFDEIAMHIADCFYQDKSGVSITQLRRVYDEVKRFERRLEINPGSWEKELPYIKMIKSKIRYATAKASKNKAPDKPYYDNLSEFITEGINSIHNEHDYQIFVSLFEAVYGFYYEHRPRD